MRSFKSYNDNISRMALLPGTDCSSVLWRRFAGRPPLSPDLTGDLEADFRASGLWETKENIMILKLTIDCSPTYAHKLVILTSRNM
jgi:hypothetical protein